jgi:nucleoside-diphosphate-sugar epimerase
MKKILICGERSFVASGFSTKLEKANIQFDCFSRGALKRQGNQVSGDVFEMSSNTYLDAYETVVNFIHVKDGKIVDNINYIKELLKFCQEKKVKNLIHISSISVYPSQATYVNEFSAIESNSSLKGGYGGIKLAVDQYLLDHRFKNIQISFVRPGFIYEKNHPISKAGILLSVFGMKVLLGNKRTTLQLIDKSRVHDALIRIVLDTEKKDVYLLLDHKSKNGTKYNFAKQQWGGRIITLPWYPIFHLAKLLKALKVINEPSFSKVLGLFKNTKFDSTISENVLKMSFDKKQFCVIGSGTYGSYICQLLSEKYPHEEIVLFEVGNDQIKS